MKRRITVLATTKRRGRGVCIAGVDGDGRWIRPVRVNGNFIDRNELFRSDRVIIDTFHEVDFELEMAVPNPPNTEDFKIAEDKRPSLVRTILNDRERFDILRKHADVNIASIFSGGNRSLGLVECKDVLEVSAGWNDSGVFYSTITFMDNSGVAHKLSTTDLRWAAFTKYFIKKRGLLNVSFNGSELHDRLQCSAMFLALGLSRESEVKMKELIIGVFTIPDYAGCRNFADLQSLEKSLL